MSLTSRLALAKVALRIRPDQAVVSKISPVIAAGVDLLVLDGGGDVEQDVQALEEFREVYARYPLLLATSNGDAAKPAAADVVHLDSPGWKLFGHYPRGHEWTLLGRNARDVRTVRSPGKDFDYLFVGPLASGQVDSKAFNSAVADQPAFVDSSLPWFAMGDFKKRDVRKLATAGVRRIALLDSVLDRDSDPASLVAATRAALQKVWDTDPDASVYVTRALTR